MSSEKLLDSLIKYASKELVEEMASKYPDEKDLHDKYSYSSKFKKSVEILINESRQENRRKRKKAFRTTLFSTFKKIAIAACILVSTFLIVAFTVPPIRNAIINFYIEKHEEYYEFRKQDSDETKTQEPNDNTTETNDIVPYIPEGFIIKDVISNELIINIIFTDGTDIIRFERTIGEGSTFIDSEDVEYDVLHIEGIDLHLFVKNGMSTLIFSKGQYSYLLSSELDVNELIKMAVEVVKN